MQTSESMIDLASIRLMLIVPTAASISVPARSALLRVNGAAASYPVPTLETPEQAYAFWQEHIATSAWSMRVQLANSDQLQAQSAAVRFGGLGRRYVLVAFNDRSVGLLSHADGSGLLPEARPKLTALSWEEIRLALMLDIGSN